MRIAVAGGTGLVGSRVVEEARRVGHEPVVLSRRHGIDLVTGEGLDGALAGAGATIDVSNFEATDPEAARRAFGGATGRLLAAASRAGVRHHLLLSIVGLDRIRGNAHYAGKKEQEALVERSPVPWTIQRATQFHEFAGMVASWTAKDGVALVAPALVQPIAVPDLARVLVEVAAGPPLGRAPDLAGPRPEDLFDMARRTLAARGDRTRLVPSWHGVYAIEAAGEILLPGPGARLATTTFDAWLAVQAPRG
jgi:uncharacterized protein YbjT (DUF2867 family)